jgi:hypothetical protein
MSESLLLGRWASINAAISAVEAHTRNVNIFVHDLCVVDVVDHRHINIVDGLVVEEVTVFPAASLITITEVAESVNDPPIETDAWPPVSGIKSVAPGSPGPIRRRPEESRLGSEHPRSGHPIIVGDVRIPSPVAGRPDVVVTRANRLRVNGQLRRSKRDGNGHLSHTRVSQHQ